MNLNFFGVEFSQVWVNNNGNLTLTIRQTEVGMTAYRTGRKLWSGGVHGRSEIQ